MAIIIKVPGINGLGKTNGCERAGDAILNLIREKFFSKEDTSPINIQLFDIEEIHIDNTNLELTNKLIYKNSMEIFETKPKTIFIGGDHSISYSTTRAFLDFCKNSGKEPCLIVFDAHPDCMPYSLNGKKKIPTHEEWLRSAIEEGFPAKNILLVGVRNSYQDETLFLKDNKIRIISMNQLLENLHDTCDIIMEFSSGKELYLSIDIDIIDPAFAPATGYPEPGGLSSREIIYLVQRIKKIKNLKGIDLVEINEKKDKDYNSMTLAIASRILCEVI